MAWKPRLDIVAHTSREADVTTEWTDIYIEEQPTQKATKVRRSSDEVFVPTVNVIIATPADIDRLEKYRTQGNG